MMDRKKAYLRHGPQLISNFKEQPPGKIFSDKLKSEAGKIGIDQLQSELFLKRKRPQITLAANRQSLLSAIYSNEQGKQKQRTTKRVVDKKYNNVNNGKMLTTKRDKLLTTKHDKLLTTKHDKFSPNQCLYCSQHEVCLGLTFQQIKAFKEIFEIIDHDKSETIDSKDIENTLKLLDFEFSKEQITSSNLNNRRDAFKNITFEAFLILMTSTEKFLETVKMFQSEEIELRADSAFLSYTFFLLTIFQLYSKKLTEQPKEIISDYYDKKWNSIKLKRPKKQSRNFESFPKLSEEQIKNTFEKLLRTLKYSSVVEKNKITEIKDDDKNSRVSNNDKNISNIKDDKISCSCNKEENISSNNHDKNVSSNTNGKNVSNSNNDKNVSSNNDDKNVSSNNDDKNVSNGNDYKNISSNNDDKNVSNSNFYTERDDKLAWKEMKRRKYQGDRRYRRHIAEVDPNFFSRVRRHAWKGKRAQYKAIKLNQVEHYLNCLSHRRPLTINDIPYMREQMQRAVEQCWVNHEILQVKKDIKLWYELQPESIPSSRLRSNFRRVFSVYTSIGEPELQYISQMK